MENNKENEIESRLQSIDEKEWEKLFAIIDKLSAEQSFGELKTTTPEGELIMPYYKKSNTTSQLWEQLTSMGLIIISFDWGKWTKRKEIFEAGSEADFSNENAVNLAKYITSIIRGDRFTEGLFINTLKNGQMLKIIKRLKELFDAGQI